MGGGGEDPADADTVLLIRSLQEKVACTSDAEKTTTTFREEILAKHIHYNQRDSHFQKRTLYVEKEICKEKLRKKDVAALIQPIREE